MSSPGNVSSVAELLEQNGAQLAQLTDSATKTEDTLAVMKALLETNVATMNRMNGEIAGLRREVASLRRRLPADEDEALIVNLVGRTEADLHRQCDEEVEGIVAKKTAEGKWPVKRRRVETFAKDPELNSLRLHSSATVEHSLCIVRNPTGQEVRNPCALCNSGTNKRKSRYACSNCGVHLCNKKRDGFAISCHEAWHHAVDLMEERRRRMEATEKYTAERKAKKGQEGKGGGEGGNAPVAEL
ncbi:hypothetical protein ACHAXT_011885 [Thalassiosira profunda]